ncbi:MAG: GerMN domain-containing protein [Thermoleophilia bacterium]|nr:GerMN domain-containing protein [Thermoleophilia bacterium]
MRLRRTSTTALIATVALLAASVLTACGDDGDGTAVTAAPPATATEPATSPATTAPATVSEQVEAEVWFVRGERVAAVTRAVTPPAVARAAMTELLRGPGADEAAAGLSTSIPAGTALLGLRITGGVAEVDLSGDFASGGGSLSMLTRVAQVVYTLTGFPTVGSVRFLIDGERVESIGGEGVIVDPPLTRADVEGPVPAAP